jgi:hypothetical protein
VAYDSHLPRNLDVADALAWQYRDPSAGMETWQHRDPSAVKSEKAQGLRMTPPRVLNSYKFQTNSKAQISTIKQRLADNEVLPLCQRMKAEAEEGVEEWTA